MKQKGNTNHYDVSPGLSVLVTGASGFLGRKIYDTFSRQHKTVGTCFKKRDADMDFIPVNITNRIAVANLFSDINFDICVHAIGLADPDYCEAHKEEAWNVNFLGTKYVAEECLSCNVRLVYISTDYIFDGKKVGGYSEDDTPNPLQFYGKAKVEAERIVVELPTSLIVRIPVIYGFNNENDKETFVKVILKNLRAGDPVAVDDRQRRCPTLIDDIAEIIHLLTGMKQTGIYHVASSEVLTKYDWALKIADVFELPRELISTKQDTVQLACRPFDSKLKIDRLCKLGVSPPRNLTEGLSEMRRQIEGAWIC